MIKINNTKTTPGIIYSTGMLTVLVFGMIMIPTKANAQMDGGFVNAYNSRPTLNTGINYGAQYNNERSNYNDYINNNQNNYNYQTPAPVPTIYSSSSNENQVNGSVVSKTISQKITATSKPTDNSSNLAASAFYGSNGFMPSGIIQWILFAILTLLLVILARKVFEVDENYYSTPMKHD